MKAALSTATALLARVGLKPSTLSNAGRAVQGGLKAHGATIGTAATVASLLPTGSRTVVVRSSEAQKYLGRYQAATQR